MIKIIGNREVAGIIALFVVVIVVGFLLAAAAIKTGSVGLLMANISSPFITYLSYALDVALALIIVMLIMSRHRHHSHSMIFNRNNLFRGLEGIVIAFTSFFMFLLVLNILAPQYSANYYDIYIALVMAISLVLLKNEFHIVKNIATMVSSIGVGIILGLNFSFEYALLIMFAFAIYDYIAVFRTKSMVTIAKELQSRDVAFLISVADIEEVETDKVGRKEVKETLKEMKEIHEDEDPKYKKILSHGRLPVLSQVSLGEGDLSIPLMIVISAYSSISNPSISIILIFGMIVGITTTMYLLKRYMIPLPAMPPFFAATAVFTGLAFIYTGYVDWDIATALMLFGALVMIVDAVAIVKERRLEAKSANVVAV